MPFYWVHTGFSGEGVEEGLPAKDFTRDPYRGLLEGVGGARGLGSLGGTEERTVRAHGSVPGPSPRLLERERCGRGSPARGGPARPSGRRGEGVPPSSRPAPVSPPERRYSLPDFSGRGGGGRVGQGRGRGAAGPTTKASVFVGRGPLKLGTLGDAGLVPCPGSPRPITGAAPGARAPGR